MTVTLILEDAHLADGRHVDVHIAGGKIAALAPPGTPVEASAERLDCAGRLVVPCFVEGHIHLDKTLLGLPFVPHRPGRDVASRIAAEQALRRELTMPVTQRGARLIEQVVKFGTGALRSHVDIDSEQGLKGLEALLELRQRYAALVDIEIVAFPQSGILRDPGTAELLDAAIRGGADLVGGLDPAGIDGDISAHLGIVFGLAERHGVGIDIHLHDPGSLGAFELRDIAARTRASGLEGRVAVSHAFALGSIDDFDFGRTAEALARARVAIMTNGPGSAPMPPIKRLNAAGVTVFAGSDNIRDAWSPYGNGDMLERAMLIGYLQDFRADADLVLAFGLATKAPAEVLGLEGHGCAPGRNADLVLIPVPSLYEAVTLHPPGRSVIKRGRIIVREGELVGPRGSH